MTSEAWMRVEVVGMEKMRFIHWVKKYLLSTYLLSNLCARFRLRYQGYSLQKASPFTGLIF